MAEGAPPGWYRTEADPDGIERYWNGVAWSEETRDVMAPPVVAAKASSGERLTPHGRRVGSPGARIGARLLDVIIVGIISVPIVDVSVDGGQLAYPTMRDAVLAVAVGAAYEILFTAFMGATPGKMALGLEIVRKETGQTPLGLVPAVMRWAPNLLGVVNTSLGFVVFLASAVLLFADRMRRTVFDFAGQTYVVRKQR